jgi:hypothetical protein
MGRNEEVFRSLNERIVAREGRRLEIVCECGVEACTERVVITYVEFYEVRRHPGWYVVSPGHLRLEIDHVIVEETAFVVVEQESRAA